MNKDYYEPIACIYGPPSEYKRQLPDVDCVVCDLGGVLIDLNLEQCFAALKRLMSQEQMNYLLGRGDMVQNLSIAKNPLLHQYEIGQISTDAFLTGVQTLCYPNVTTSQIRDAWFSMLGDLPQQRLDYIGSLRKCGVKTLLLSNTNELHWDYINMRYKVSDYFDELCLSHVMHLSKPDVDIFHAVAQLCGCSAERTMYIDDVEVNRRAAEQFVGWKTSPSIGASGLQTPMD